MFQEKTAIFLTITLALIFSALFGIVVMDRNALGNSLSLIRVKNYQNVFEILYTNFTKVLAKSAVVTFSTPFQFEGSIVDNFPVPVVVVLGIGFQILHVFTCFFWVLTYCSLLLWSFMFRKLYAGFLFKIKMEKCFGKDILKVLSMSNYHKMLIF